MTNKMTNKSVNTIKDMSLSTHHVRVDLGRVAKRYNASPATAHLMESCYNTALSIKLQTGRSCVITQKDSLGGRVQLRKSSPRSGARPTYSLVSVKEVM